MKPMASRSAKDKGDALEAQIEKFFASNRYETQRNVTLVGRSGGRHEIDVLAKKRDGVTEVSIMVECKAWNKPIDKDTISKVSYIVSDLGVNKGIVVSLEGWRIGAERAAKELGIELWDSFLLEKRLGQVVVAQLKGTGPQRHALGIPVAIGREQAEGVLEKERAGFFGKERIEWIVLTWLPFFLFDIRLTREEQRFFGGSRFKSTRILNLYEGISGEYTHALAYEPDLREIADANIIPPRVTDRKLISTINHEFSRLNKLVNGSAIERQQAKVRDLGIPLDTDSVSVDGTKQLVVPYYVGLFNREGEQRLVAVDALTGRASPIINGILTESLSYILEAVRR